jgi:glyoxylase-like metal-dependent hydrolase (beta-lactamase superfamily II)/rhodanese-related sulfurtransferase
MIFRQLFDSVSSTYTYLLASRRGGEALIIDPVLDKVNRYIQLVEELDVRLVKAIDTHVHADHVTGLGALRDRTRCTTVMGEQSKVDTVSMRVADGDVIEADGLRLTAIYTPGHTDDSYCFLYDDRVFTGDTLLIRGTGRTDFQNGNARAQYESLFNRLLKLPDDMLVYPAHDYKGDTVSTIREEKAFNPRLQVKSVDEYVELMSKLDLPNPKMMDVAVPKNLRIGLSQAELDAQGRSFSVEQALKALEMESVFFVDLREEPERLRHGSIPGSLHVPYPGLGAELKQGGLLQELASATRKRVVFYCAYGERSAMALQAADSAGVMDTAHLKGGIDAWKKAGGPIAAVKSEQH